jgi:hypothetical protein
MSKPRVYPPISRRYYARHRTMPLLGSDGMPAAEADALTTRYAYRTGRRRTTGPRGGRAYQEFWRDVYYVRELALWCEIRRVPTELSTDGEPASWAAVLAPIASATLRDVHAEQTAAAGLDVCTIEVRDGLATRVTARVGQGPYVLYDAGEDAGQWPAVAAWLRLDAPRRGAAA